MPISEFFAAWNEETFRDLEYQILMELAQYTRLVISTGGGIVERNTNWGVMRHGLVVFLDMKPNDIYNRLCNDPEQLFKRPLLQCEDPQQKLKDMRDLRIDKYEQADIKIEVTSDLRYLRFSLLFLKKRSACLLSVIIFDSLFKD